MGVEAFGDPLISEVHTSMGYRRSIRLQCDGVIIWLFDNYPRQYTPISNLLMDIIDFPHILLATSRLRRARSRGIIVANSQRGNV